MSMIRFENVTKVYEESKEGAVKNLSFQIERGSFLFLTGKSGAGKSTVIKLLLKEIEPSSGRIWVNGNNISDMKRRNVPKYRQGMGVVFQDFCLFQDRNVFQNVAVAQSIVGRPKKGTQRQVSSILSLLGLAEKFRALPKELSGGEQQKVCLARAVVNQPAILLADEPTGNLDPENSREVMKLLDILHKRGTTVVVVTHDLQLAEEMGHPVLSL